MTQHVADTCLPLLCGKQPGKLFFLSDMIGSHKPWKLLFLLKMSLAIKNVSFKCLTHQTSAADDNNVTCQQ